MLSDIHNRLMEAKTRLRTRQKLDAMLREARAALEDEQDHCRDHEQTLAAERADVEKLEGLSLTGLFYAVLGAKEERLEKERQEYLAAKLKHEESTKGVAEARRELERLQLELDAHADADAEYQRLLEEKQQALTRTGDKRGEAIAKLSERLADLEADRKELREAIDAGEAARRALEDVRTELRSAESWGTWDLFGGGLLATMTKHSRIDAARQRASAAQRHLRRFQEELADADQRLHVSLGEIGGFTTFADYFFDGLIADWVVQSKVRNALDACSSSLSNVAAALRECQRRLATVEQEIEQASEQKRNLLEQA
jgi:DNA repair exonuclease SbcCD ATPase subunit